MKSTSTSRQIRNQEHEGQYNHKIYTKILNQLLSQHKQTIQRYFRMAESERDSSTLLQSGQNSSIFTKNIQEILESFLLSKQIYQQTIEELITCMSSQINKILIKLKDEEVQDYQETIKNNQKLIPQKKKKSQQIDFQLTVPRMVKLDFLSSFLKVNYKCRKNHKIRGSVIGNKFLCKAFEIKSEVQLKLYSTQFRTYFQFIQFPYQKELKQLILLCTIVELKSKISGFRKKFGKKIAQKAQSSIKIVQSKQVQIKQQQESEQNNVQYSVQYYQFKFCQLIFIPFIKGEDIYNKSSLQRAQIKLLLQNIINIGNVLQRKRQLLKIKLKYSINFQSLFIFVENQQKMQNEDEINQENLKNLQKAQWAFLQNNQKKTIKNLKKILKLQIPSSTNYMNEKSLLMISLCRITMRRIALFTNVNKAHQKIDIFLKRQSIYIYKLEFPYSEFSKKTQQDDKNDDEVSQIFTVILATTDKEIVYAAMFQCKLNEYQFARAIKIATTKINLENFSIFFYIIFDPKPFDWHCIDGLFVIRHHHDVRLYFSASPQPFLIHFCAYHLISMLIKKYKPTSQTFLNIAENSVFKVINAFSGSAKARLICSQINQPISQTIDQTYYEQFEEQKMKNQFGRIYKCLNGEIIKLNQNFQIEEQDLFKNGKLYFFKNKTQEKQEIDDNQIHYFKRISSFKPVVSDQEQQFVERLIHQMKCRHPYLTNEQKQLLSESAYPILFKKNIRKKDLIKILSAVLRFLLCYQVYFNQMMNRGQLLDIPHSLINQVTFLKRTYLIEQKQLDKFQENNIPNMVKNYFCMNYLTGKKMSRDYKKQLHLNQQPNDYFVQKNEYVSEQQAENKKNLTNNQSQYRKQ